MERTGWIGVDLDGTLAEFDMNRWVREGFSYVGDPIPLMLERVKGWLAKGIRVKIFTARACVNPFCYLPPILNWLERVGLPYLEITNAKDLEMVALYDDIAWRVEKNTGRINF